MKKKKYLAILMLTSSLAACGNVKTGSDLTSDSSSENGSAASSLRSDGSSDDSLLLEHDPMKDTYGNAMKLPPTGSSQEAADPFIFRWNGVYYLYVTTGGNGIRGYQSTDLINWERVQAEGLAAGYVYEYSKDTGGNKPSSGTPYAPEVTYFNGKFYLVTSPSGKGHYILESDYPEGPFESITDNLGKSIDGDFFLDGDEQPYLLTAGSSSIVMYKLGDDFSSFEKVNGTSTVFSQSLTACHIGDWNEGPYVLHRNGAYYVTYTGTHFLSPTYRVDYAYAPQGSDPSKSSSYEREDTVLLSTESTYRGLGHSCTVLGPDMDSYYIAYHNLELNNQRFLNLERLSFSGSRMVANDVKREGNFVPSSPDFSSIDKSGLAEDGQFLLSPSSAKAEFTVEYTAIGEGRMVFDYLDGSHYAYIAPDYENKKIELYSVMNGTSSLTASVALNHVFDSKVYHTIRLSYASGLMNLYFDGMEKASLVQASFSGGRMGYVKDSFDLIGYTAFSNVGMGTSDKKEYNDRLILANAYDEKLSSLSAGSGLSEVEKGAYRIGGSYNIELKSKGDRATYRIYSPANGDYEIDLRVPASSLGKRIGLRSDGGEILISVIPNGSPRVSTGDVLLNVATLSLAEGQHNLSLYDVGDDVSFGEINLVQSQDNDVFAEIFNSSFDPSSYIVRGSLSSSEEGLSFDSSCVNGLLTASSYRNETVTASLKANEFLSNGFVALLLNVQDYGKNYSGDGDGADNPDTFRGYEFLLNGNQAILRYVDYNFSSTLKSVSFSFPLNQEIVIKGEQKNSTFVFSINGTQIIAIDANIGNLFGKAGVFAKGAKGSFISLGVA